MKMGILPCQGACNVGCITEKSALHFVDNEKITMVCALGLPLHLESITRNAKSNDHFLALNGCDLCCASKALDAAGITGYEEISLTGDLGLKKSKDYADQSGLDRLDSMVKEKIQAFFGPAKE